MANKAPHDNSAGAQTTAAVLVHCQVMPSCTHHMGTHTLPFVRHQIFPLTWYPFPTLLHNRLHAHMLLCANYTLFPNPLHTGANTCLSIKVTVCTQTGKASCLLLVQCELHCIYLHMLTGCRRYTIAQEEDTGE